MVFVSQSGAVPTVGVNSYVTVDEVAGYADTHFYTFTSSQRTNIRQFIFRAMDYVESYRDKFQGRKTSPTQPLQWPRQGVVLDGIAVAEDVIPDEIKEAVSICSIEMIQGFDPNRPLRPLDDAETSSNVGGAVVTSVSDRYLNEWGLADQLPHVEALLKPLLRADIDDLQLSL